MQKSRMANKLKADLLSASSNIIPGSTDYIPTSAEFVVEIVAFNTKCNTLITLGSFLLLGHILNSA
jgi:hypothetical protein